MIAIPGFAVQALLYEGASSLVYRGVREPDRQPVIIKILNEDYPSSEKLNRYKKEYEILRSLNASGVCEVFYLESYKNSLAIVLEDWGGESLNFLRKSKSFTLKEILAIGIKVAEALGEIHAAHIIHKDINPSNIVLNPETGQLKIIDFGISTVLSRENPILKNPSVLEGTLAYISPEQTGRMNRCLDYRTDFYSLGVTLYELLAHQLPFDAIDAMELVHCHLAKQPVPLCEIKTQKEDEEKGKIPRVVSDIVMKLMAKTAEERYQSAWGIKADLQECWERLEFQGEITEFPLGCQDISDKFTIPEKLYGREREVETLLAAFERVADGKNTEELNLRQDNGTKIEEEKDLKFYPSSKLRKTSEMMLVAGYSGIGKSSLIAELYKPITRQRGYFISGKFDQFLRNIPYLAIAKAFSDLMRQLLTETEENLNEWKKKLQAALSLNGQIIVDVIPEVELIIGKQPPVQTLAPAEARNRFNLVFLNFIRVFGQPEHPLAIFLDDLQWADSATLELIELMMSDENIHHLLLMGAYRDNEVSPTDPLIRTIDRLRQDGAIASEIRLAPLTNEQVAQLIADTLHREEEEVKPLASAIVRKTEGNPFFVNEFLKTLYQENLLVFNPPESYPSQSGWQWDLDFIEASAITENVVELMIGKLKKLPQSTQQVLRLAACVGNRFDLNTLSFIHEKPPTDTFKDLWPAIQEELVLPLSQSEVLALKLLDVQLLSADFKFLHDRVQQAAAGLIDENVKKTIHLKIGRLLLIYTPLKERPERIFEIVDHLNFGRKLITDDEEKIELARLNLEAGEKAKNATAYAAAREYLKAGMESLPKKIWKKDYELALAVHKERALVEYLNGNFETSEELIHITLQEARSPLEKAEVYNQLIVMLTLQAKYQNAIEVGRTALALLGIEWSASDLQAALTDELAQAKKNVGDRDIASLLNQPAMTDREKKVALKVLTNLASPTFFSDPELFPIVTLKSVNLSLTSGHTPESSLGYSNYGPILVSMLGDYHTGYEFGKLAIQLCDRLNDRAQKCKSCFVFGYELNPWLHPIKETDLIVDEAYQAALDSGELEWAGYILMFELFYGFYQGKTLDSLMLDIPKCLLFTQKTKNQAANDVILGFELNLTNLSAVSAEKLDDRRDRVREESYVERCDRHQSFIAICLYQIVKSQKLYLEGKPAAALEYSLAAEKFIAFVKGFLSISEHNFYYSLNLAAVYPEASALNRKEYWEKLQANQKQMKIWADNCPENFLHKYLLVAAEMARLSGQDLEAMELYDRAIASARENQFLQNVALANELAAKFWLNKGKEHFAKLYMNEAYYGYQRWGAKSKVEDLEALYPHWLTQTAVGVNSTTVTVTHTTTTSADTNRSSVAALDITTILKASQVLAGEIVLVRLLEKLMKLAIENAGAESGFLILARGEQLVIEACVAVDGENFTLRQCLPVESTDLLPVSVIHYVARTEENVVLNDAAVEGLFINDPYIAVHQPKSILCTPIQGLGKLIGILYLENNLTKGAFKRDRIEVLKLLCSQAAISLENALLYEQLGDYSRTLERKVEERTQELTDKNQQLQQTLKQLTAAQKQIIAQEKLASLGSLTAGIAHEIRNPLNFVNNFATVSVELSKELMEEIETQSECLDPDNVDSIKEILNDLAENLAEINRQGQRADSIIQSMLIHSRTDSGQLQLSDLNNILDESVRFAYHGMRANSPRFNIQIETDYDRSLSQVEVVPPALSRAFLNILNNACYALIAKKKELGEAFTPLLSIQTRNLNESIEIRIRDNGSGIPPHIQEEIFNPFFTTKPAGEGTGLGLSLTHDIIVGQHQGQIAVATELGFYAEFIIVLPKNPR